MTDFSHYGPEGAPRMVDISGKEKTRRLARAECYVHISEETKSRIEQQLLPKGDPFDIARIAGIMGAKKTSELIPMCHQLNLSSIDCVLTLESEKCRIKIESEIILNDRTGAEMEALTTVSIAALTIYDMCKAVDKKIVIDGIRLVEKMGGKSGHLKL